MSFFASARARIFSIRNQRFPRYLASLDSSTPRDSRYLEGRHERVFPRIALRNAKVRTGRRSTRKRRGKRASLRQGGYPVNSRAVSAKSYALKPTHHRTDTPCMTRLGGGGPNRPAVSRGWRESSAGRLVRRRWRHPAGLFGGSGVGGGRGCEISRETPRPRCNVVNAGERERIDDDDDENSPAESRYETRALATCGRRA